MAKGMAVPVRASTAGGAEKNKGSRQTDKILRLALAEGDDKNPFQLLGLSPKIVYQTQGPLSAADVKLEVERILKKFKGKIAIDPSDPIRLVREDEDLKVIFGYIDLETNEVKEFNQFLTRPGGQT